MLDHCPQCDYALQGLPAQHQCPECGLNYDKNSELFKQVRVRLLLVLPLLLIAISQTIRLLSPRGLFLSITIPCFVVNLFLIVSFLRTPRNRAVISPYGISLLRRGQAPIQIAWAEIRSVGPSSRQGFEILGHDGATLFRNRSGYFASLRVQVEFLISANRWLERYQHGLSTGACEAT